MHNKIILVGDNRSLPGLKEVLYSTPLSLDIFLEDAKELEQKPVLSLERLLKRMIDDNINEIVQKLMAKKNQAKEDIRQYIHDVAPEFLSLEDIRQAVRKEPTQKLVSEGSISEALTFLCQQKFIYPYVYFSKDLEAHIVFICSDKGKGIDVKLLKDRCFSYSLAEIDGALKEYLGSRPTISTEDPAEILFERQKYDPEALLVAHTGFLQNISTRAQEGFLLFENGKRLQFNPINIHDIEDDVADYIMKTSPAVIELVPGYHIFSGNLRMSPLPQNIAALPDEIVHYRVQAAALEKFALPLIRGICNSASPNSALLSDAGMIDRFINTSYSQDPVFGLQTIERVGDLCDLIKGFLDNKFEDSKRTFSAEEMKKITTGLGFVEALRDNLLRNYDHIKRKIVPIAKEETPEEILPSSVDEIQLPDIPDTIKDAVFYIRWIFKNVILPGFISLTATGIFNLTLEFPFIWTLLICSGISYLFPFYSWVYDRNQARKRRQAITSHFAIELSPVKKQTVKTKQEVRKLHIPKPVITPLGSFIQKNIDKHFPGKNTSLDNIIGSEHTLTQTIDTITSNLAADYNIKRADKITDDEMRNELMKYMEILSVFVFKKKVPSCYQNKSKNEVMVLIAGTDRTQKNASINKLFEIYKKVHDHRDAPSKKEFYVEALNRAQEHILKRKN